MKRKRSNFGDLWRLGIVQRGDVLLFDYSGCGGLRLQARVIRAVQRRLLRDLGVEEHVRIRESGFSHAGLAGLAGARGVILEMTSPRARLRQVSDLPRGVRVMVRRPRDGGEDIGEALGRRIEDCAWRDVSAGRRYPYGELLTYWVWSWGLCKLLLGRRFASVFRSDRADVCSGSVWRWCLEAGLYRDSSEGDLRPEAWYPARLAADWEGGFRTVGVWELG